MADDSSTEALLPVLCCFSKRQRRLGSVGAENKDVVVILIKGGRFLSMRYMPGIALGPFQLVAHSVFSHLSFLLQLKKQVQKG